MASHSALQFVPSPSKGQTTPLAERIAALLEGVPLGAKRGPFKKSEETSVRSALPLLALAQDWAGLVNVTSQAVLARGSFNFELDCYRGWMEALRANFELEALQLLAKHLLAQRERGSAFVALSLIALTYCGRTGYARALCKRLQKQESRTQFEVEAIAVFLSESAIPAQRQKSVRLQHMLADAQPANLWIVRNFLHSALENDAFEAAAHAFKLLHAAWPEAAEPYWSAASLAAMEGAWGDAATTTASLIDVAGDSPEAAVVLAQCYEQAGDLLAARKILQERSDGFDDADYEFQITYGSIHFKLHARYRLQEYRTVAVRHLANAAGCAKAFGVSDAPIHLMLHALHAGVGETKVAAPKQKEQESRYWLLEVDDARFAKLAEKDFTLSSVPGEVSQGDTIILARHNRKYAGDDFQVVGWMSVDSTVVQDCIHGPTAMTGAVHTFPEFIPAKFESGAEVLGDAFGCHNFARNGLAKYYRLSREAGQGVFIYADKTYAVGAQKGSQHAI